MRGSLKITLMLALVAAAVSAGVTGSGAAATKVAPPRYIDVPTISTVRVGQTLVASPGTWSGATPMTFSYTWMYGKPGSATPIPAATGQTYTLKPADVGKQIWVQVKAENSGGHFWANSTPTATVAGPVTTGATTLLDGRTSMPVAQVDPTNRLVVATIQFDPLSLKANGSATMQVTVADRYQRPVHGAQVQVIALPFGSLQVVKTATTDMTGVATITLRGRPKVLDHVPGNAIALYVQATKPGDNVLTGVTGTRIVELKISH